LRAGRRKMSQPDRNSFTSRTTDSGLPLSEKYADLAPVSDYCGDGGLQGIAIVQNLVQGDACASSGSEKLDLNYSKAVLTAIVASETDSRMLTSNRTLAI
jgi:hypothetical protein